MGKLLKFPGQSAKPLPVDLSGDAIKRALPRAATLRGGALWLLRFVRVPVFLVMYWLRLPVQFIAGIISVPMLLAWLFSLYAFPDKTTMVWGFGFASFAAFVAGWLYDFVLMAIAPQDMVQSL